MWRLPIASNSAFIMVEGVVSLLSIGKRFCDKYDVSKSEKDLTVGGKIMNIHYLSELTVYARRS